MIGTKAIDQEKLSEQGKEVVAHSNAGIWSGSKKENYRKQTKQELGEIK